MDPRAAALELLSTAPTERANGRGKRWRRPFGRNSMNFVEWPGKEIRVCRDGTMGAPDDSPSPSRLTRLVGGAESVRGFVEEQAFLKMLGADFPLHARPADVQWFYYALKLVQGVDVDPDVRLDCEDD
jgi:hypothetical protein